METVPPGGSLYTLLALFCVALLFCGLYSFLEMCVTTMRLFKLKELSQTNSSYQALLDLLEKNQNRVLTTILIASSLADVFAASIGTQIADKMFATLPTSLSVPLGIIFTTAAILIFGEILPKNIAKAFGDKLFSSTLWITNITYYMLFPVVTIFSHFSEYIIAKIGGKRDHSGDNIVTSEKEIQFLIDYIDEKGLIEREKTAMLKSVFELGTTPVKEIMVPETAIVSISVEAPINTVLSVFHKYQFSRMPVYEGNSDNIIGMLHLKDLVTLLFKNETPLTKDILRPIMFVPENLKVNKLLQEFKDQRMHIAMVINEHGGIIGLVTLEDVLEEIVGDIQDEYESTTEKIIPLKDDAWLTDASINLDDLEARLHINFEREHALTLGGFLTEQLHRVPKKGERLLYKGYNFQVQQATAKRVIQVLIFKVSEDKEPVVE